MCAPGLRRERQDAFSDLQVNVAGAPSLHAALSQYVQQEVLKGSNQWECDRCGKKVDALKGLQLTALPPLLTIQLKVRRRPKVPCVAIEVAASLAPVKGFLTGTVPAHRGSALIGRQAAV